MIKTLNKIGIDGNFLNLINTNPPRVNIIHTLW